MWFKVAEVHVETLETSDLYEDNSPDSEPECTLSTPLNEIRAESPPFSKPTHSSISDNNHFDSDIFYHYFEYRQCNGQFGLFLSTEIT